MSQKKSREEAVVVQEVCLDTVATLATMIPLMEASIRIERQLLPKVLLVRQL
jgi:hypothetical protein